MADKRKTRRRGQPHPIARILVAEACPLLRSGLRALLASETDLRIVGEAGTLRAAVQLIENVHPNLLILDTALVAAAEQDLVEELSRSCARLRTLALTPPEPHHHALAVKLGTSGVLCKDAPLVLVLTCIRSVLAGQYCIAREHVAAMSRSGRAGLKESCAGDSAFALTAREEQVVTAIASGSTNKEIAEQLAISLTTVKHHLSNVFAKTHLPNRLALGTFAVAHHLVP